MNWYIPKNIKTNYISGYKYNDICKWSFCNRYTFNFKSDEILEDDLVFLNLDLFEYFINYLNTNKPINKFVLVTQNSDRDFTESMFNSVDPFISKLLAINCTFSNYKIKKIPLGFNDQSVEEIDKKDFRFVEKSNLIYMNFNLNHHTERRTCFNYFKNFDWVTIDSQCINDTKITFDSFYDKIKTFKYCLSPRGAGIDTHRLYESLLFGVIPIVKSSELDDLYKQFPIIIVDKWEDVTYDFLVDNYDENLKKYFDWFDSNKDWFKSEYWIKK